MPDTLLMLTGIAASLAAIRNIPLFAIVAAPLVAGAVQAMSPDPSIRMPPIEVPCPPRNFVADCTTISAPWAVEAAATVRATGCGGEVAPVLKVQVQGAARLTARPSNHPRSRQCSAGISGPQMADKANIQMKSTSIQLRKALKKKIKGNLVRVQKISLNILSVLPASASILS